MKKTTLLFLGAILALLPVQAQYYVVDEVMADSARTYAVVKKDTAYSRGKELTPIANGDTVYAIGPATGSYVRCRHNGREVAIFRNSLVFSDDNPEGTEDTYSNPKAAKRHTAIAHFYTTSTPLYIILGLFLFTALLGLFGGRWEAVRMKAALLFSICILIASLLEILGYYLLGSDAFWWCDYDRYGFWGSLWRVIPLGLVVAYQFYSIYLFERLLLPDEGEYSDRKISIKPAAIGLAGCIPLTVIAVLIAQNALDLSQLWVDIVGASTLLLTLVLGIFLTLRKNSKVFGKMLGILVTLFSIVYIIAGIISAIILIVIIFKLIIQILMVLAAIVILALVGGSERYRDSWGRVYEKDAFGNVHRVN